MWSPAGTISIENILRLYVGPVGMVHKYIDPTGLQNFLWNLFYRYINPTG